MARIKALRLTNFKAFENFSVSFRGLSLLVGPNNAGKSTLISTLRSAALMIRFAARRNPEVRETASGHLWVYPIGPGQFGIEEENLRHEFRAEKASFEIEFLNPAFTLKAVWPEGNLESAYFFLIRKSGSQPMKAAAVTKIVPEIGVIPVLTPVEQSEALLDPKYVRDNFGGRLSSRHLRNQLVLLKGNDLARQPALTFSGFCEFLSTWAPEISIEAPRLDFSSNALDLYYTERVGTAKEIVWAGDGMQVWLQILLHVYALREAAVMILDEPDIYLHADLQRRLLRLLTGLQCQSVLATHSAEMVGEAPPEAVVWVEKSRTQAVSAPKDDQLSSLLDSIGSGFNIRVAKTLRDPVALFVEGRDMSILGLIAETVGARSLSIEKGVTVVPLGGFENWRRLEGFNWIAEHLLGETVNGYVILDRDYHSQEMVNDVTGKLNATGLKAHVWKRKELESYLLNPDAISRVSGAEAGWVARTLRSEAEALRNVVLGNTLSTRLKERKDRSIDSSTLTTQLADSFDALMRTGDHVFRVPAKDLLSALNQRLQEGGLSAVSRRRLARELKAEEVPEEMSSLLLRVEEDLVS